MTLYDQDIIDNVVENNIKERKYRKLYDAFDAQSDLIPGAHKNDEYLRINNPNQTTKIKNQINYI